MIRGAVSFNSSQIPPWRIRVDDPKVDAEERDANLRMHDPALLFERILHSFLERRFGAAAGRREGLRDRARSILRKLQKVLKVDNTAGVGPSEIDLLGLQRR